MKKEGWYQFARIVANSLSHNFRLEFRRPDLSLLPVTYRGVSIDKSMDGKTIEITLEHLIQLVDEIIAFSGLRKRG
jgi:hypothetical protein